MSQAIVALVAGSLPFALQNGPCTEAWLLLTISLEGLGSRACEEGMLGTFFKCGIYIIFFLGFRVQGDGPYRA